MVGRRNRTAIFSRSGGLRTALKKLDFIGFQILQENAITSEIFRQGIAQAGTNGFPGPHRVVAKVFVHHLPIGSCLDQGHQESFRARKWSVYRQIARNGILIDIQSVHQPLRGSDQFICDQKRFGQKGAPVGGIVQGALEQ